MKSIKVSDATHRALLECAVLPVRRTATREADGNWLVPITDDTWEAFQKERLPNESDDDTVMRIVRRHLGQKPS